MKITEGKWPGRAERQQLCQLGSPVFPRDFPRCELHSHSCHLPLQATLLFQATGSQLPSSFTTIRSDLTPRQPCPAPGAERRFSLKGKQDGHLPSWVLDTTFSHTCVATLALSAGAQISRANPVFQGIQKTSHPILNYWADLLCSCLGPQSPPWTCDWAPN